MATVTYEQLHTESLLTINFSLLTENFKTIDSFIKNFSSFQRKLNDLEKSQKATAHDLSNFKISTQNTFSTLNDMVETRAGASKGASLADSQQIKEIKKSFKQIKTFITENTRQQHEAQQVRDKQAEEVKEGFNKKIQDLKKQLQQKSFKITQLQQEAQSIKQKYSTKYEFQGLSNKLKQNTQSSQGTKNQLHQIQSMLDNLNVKGFKDTIDTFQNQIKTDFEQIKRKFKLKADYSDVLKLQEMLLNLINFSHQNAFTKLADKNQTKKALVFLQKRMNKLMVTLYGDDEGDKQGLVTTKGIKCISCTKDLGQFQGKLDKYKAWSVFPSKDPQIKDRYSGFGAGFQTIVQSTVNKKGGDISYDQKGRMTAPFNLTRQVSAGTGTLLKPSQSQSKITRDTPTKTPATGNKNLSPTKFQQVQTNFMGNFGRFSQPNVDLKQQYRDKERGLMAYIKLVMDSAEKQEKNIN